MVLKQELKEQHQVLISALLAIESAKETKRQAQLQILFRASHTIKGAAKSVSLDDIARIAHELENKFSEWKDKNKPLTKEDTAYCMKQADLMLEVFHKHQSSNYDQVFIKIPLSKIENANTKADEFLTYRLRLENWVKTIREYLKTSHDDHLRSIADNANQFLGEFSRSLQNLQDNLRVMRLVPIDTILKPLERVVHDLGNTMHKKVALQVSGTDIEIDKPILDHLKDALQHLVRNAMINGIA